MSKIQLKIKKLNDNAVIPSYAKPGDAGMDLTATSVSFKELEHGVRQVTYGTGLAFEIPAGHVGLLFPRSSVTKTALSLGNSVGVIDSQYRGEVMFKFNISPNSRPTKESAYDIGDRIGQLIVLPYPEVNIEVVDNLSDTERGEGGFGSSGR